MIGFFGGILNYCPILGIGLPIFLESLVLVLGLQKYFRGKGQLLLRYNSIFFYSMKPQALYSGIIGLRVNFKFMNYFIGFVGLGIG